MDDVENFPWMKSVFQAFSRTFPGDYSNESLKILHTNLQIEMQKAIKNKDQECLQKLFSCVRYLYGHFCWKINNLKNYSIMKISCVKILSSLVQIGIILRKKNSTINSINIILAALKIFPGTFEMLCDALLLLNNWKKYHYEDFGLVLKQFLFTTKFDVKEPSSYFKALLLLRRLKLLSKDSFEKSKIISLAKKMKVPSDSISWMLENGIENASTLNNKSIVKQFFSKKLPATFFVQLRQVLQKELYENFLPVDSKTNTAESSIFDSSNIFKIDLERDECLIANSSNENEAVYYNKKEIDSSNKNVLIENDVLHSNTFDTNSFPLHSQQAESVTDSFVSDYSENSSYNNCYKKNNQANITMINKKSEIIQASITCVENSITDVFLNPEKEIIESAESESSLIANVHTPKHYDQRNKKCERKICIENEIVLSLNTDDELLNSLQKTSQQFTKSTSNKIGIDENGSSKASLLEINPEVCCSNTESSDLQINVNELSPKLNETNNVNNAEWNIKHFTESSFESEKFQRPEEVFNNLRNPLLKICQTAVKDCEFGNILGESTTPISNSKTILTDSSSKSNILTKVNCLTSSESCLEMPVTKENNQSLEVCKEFKKEKHSCDSLKQSQSVDSVPQFEITETKNCFDCSHVPDRKEVLDSYIGNILYKIVDKVANQIDNNNENNSFETLKETVLNEDITPLKNPFKTSSNSVCHTPSLHNTGNPFSLGKIAEYLSFSDVSLDSVKNKKYDNIFSAPLFNKVTGKYNNYRDLVRDDISDSASNVVIDDDECNEADSDIEIDSAQCVLFDEESKQDITCDKNSKEICVETYCDPLPESQQFLNESTKAYEQSFNMEEANIFVDLQPKLVVNLGKRCKVDEDFYCENRYKAQTCVEEPKNELQNIKESKECTEINEEISMNNCKSPEGLFYQLNANLDTISKEENTDINEMKLQENESSSIAINGVPLSQSNTKELTLSATDHSEHVEFTKSPTQEKSLSLQLKPPFQSESTTVAVENHNFSEHVEFINSSIQEKNLSIQLKLPTPYESTSATVEKVQPRMNLRKRNLPPVDENKNFKKIGLSKKRYSSKVPGSPDVNLDISKLTIGSPPEKKLCKTMSALKNKKEEKGIFQLSNQNADVRNEESKKTKSYNLRSSSSLIKPSRLKF